MAAMHLIDDGGAEICKEDPPLGKVREIRATPRTHLYVCKCVNITVTEGQAYFSCQLLGGVHGSKGVWLSG